MGHLGVVEHQGQVYWDAEAPELLTDVRFFHARKRYESNYYFQVLVHKIRHSLGQLDPNIRSGMDNMGSAVTRFNAKMCCVVMRLRCDMMRCGVMLCGVMPCDVMPCDMMPCDVMPCEVMPCDAM